MESFPSRKLAEKRLGTVTEKHNSSLTLVLLRKTGCYMLFLNEEACIIEIIYFLFSEKKKNPHRVPVWLKEFRSNR